MVVEKSLTKLETLRDGFDIFTFHTLVSLVLTKNEMTQTLSNIKPEWIRLRQYRNQPSLVAGCGLFSQCLGDKSSIHRGKFRNIFYVSCKLTLATMGRLQPQQCCSIRVESSGFDNNFNLPSQPLAEYFVKCLADRHSIC